MNICIVVGARPNFVKAAPIIRAVQAARQKGEIINGELVFAGSEDDKSIEPSLFDDLMMPHPDTYLGADSDNLNELTGMVMSKFEQYLDQHPTDVVIVVDDLTSTMAASIVAKKRGLLLAHLVAGTRSFDITMPKEVNRLVIDGLSDLLFTAGVSGNSTATREGAGQEKIYMVGNILIDSLRHNRQRMVRPAILDSLGLTDGSYLVFTLNRHIRCLQPACHAACRHQCRRTDAHHSPTARTVSTGREVNSLRRVMHKHPFSRDRRNELS